MICDISIYLPKNMLKIFPFVLIQCISWHFVHWSKLLLEPQHTLTCVHVRNRKSMFFFLLQIVPVYIWWPTQLGFKKPCVYITVIHYLHLYVWFYICVRQGTTIRLCFVCFCFTTTKKHQKNYGHQFISGSMVFVPIHPFDRRNSRLEALWDRPSYRMRRFNLTVEPGDGTVDFWGCGRCRTSTTNETPNFTIIWMENQIMVVEVVEVLQKLKHLLGHGNQLHDKLEFTSMFLKWEKHIYNDVLCSISM